MQCKGYYTGSCYNGWVGNGYMKFPSDTEYLEYIRECGSDGSSNNGSEE